MVYEASKDAIGGHQDERGLAMTPQVLTLYESTCIMQDQSWYVENGIMSRRQLLDQNANAMNAMLPLLEGLINDPAVDAFNTAPMVDLDRLADFFHSLLLFQGPDIRFISAKL